MQRQIKIMSEQGHSIRTIARVLKLSRRTVRNYLAPAPSVTEKTGGWED
jgi:DNA-binding CsgD family transcriptional regulator